jgi:UDP-N-acetylmuramoyl-L-alanyl-D-glutamate--2,6-diaminopimelate ligase
MVVQSPWGKAVIRTGLLGKFNIENILAAFTVLCIYRFPVDQIATILSDFSGLPGRMESFSSKDKPLIVVDYAHTPDALEKALIALRFYCSGKLFCIFGCGGGRDIGKRAQMGSVAESLSDQIILTNDNLRNELPDHIFENILEGIKDKSKVIIKHDRSDALISTFIDAKKGDVILLAGKGHEITQQIGSTMIPFSDRELAKRLTEGYS